MTPYQVRERDGILIFDSLDKSHYLERVFAIGYRFKDDPGERWTRFVNRVKAGDKEKVEAASRALLLGLVRAPIPSPLCVAPILGSGDTETVDSSPVAQLAQAIGGLPDNEYAPNLLTKCEHTPLHQIYTAEERDAEVEGTYSSRPLTDVAPTECAGVLLIDDLVTRGTTLNEAARAIRAANGELSIYGFALGKTESRSYAGSRATNDHIPADILMVAGLD